MNNLLRNGGRAGLCSYILALTCEENGIYSITAATLAEAKKNIATAFVNGEQIYITVSSLTQKPILQSVNSIYKNNEDGFVLDTYDYHIVISKSDLTVNKISHEGGDSLWEPGAGEGSIQTKGTGCDARGQYSAAEGLGTLAESDLSHAEGWVTRTIIDDTDRDTYGHASHAEGSHTIAKGACSHAEGNTTESMGLYSHAEGSGSISGGRSSHAEGDGTLTNNVAEHAEGSYNKSHSVKDGDAQNTIHSIGIGTSMSDRKNAVEVMSNGDAYIKGVGNYDGVNISDARTIQEVINNYSTGVITVAKDVGLVADVEEVEGQRKILSFNAGILRASFPQDFITEPERYNLIVRIYGKNTDFGLDTSIGYTANHFCYVVDRDENDDVSLIEYRCYDALDKDANVYHYTTLTIGLSELYQLQYEGKAGGETMLDEYNSKVSVYLQKLY